MSRSRDVTVIIAALLMMAVATAPPAATAPGWIGLGFTYSVNKNGDGWLLIRYVLQGSPAATADFHVGDVVTEIEGKPLRFKSLAEVLDAFAAVKPGQKMKFTVIRAEGQKTITLVATQMPPEQAARWRRNWAMAHRQVQ